MGLTEASAFKDGSIVNNDVKSDAAIQGTKISPNFGSQNITTTGDLNAGNVTTLTGINPRINFVDSTDNPDYKIQLDSGRLAFRDVTNTTDRIVIESDGHVDVTGNLDVGAGVDITGNLTVTGTTTLPNQGNGLVPVGTVITFAGASAPTGYLKSNGDTIPDGSGTVQGVTADFSALYAIVGATLPDLRGEFVRGVDDSRGVDSGRAIRSTQADEFKNHQHVFGGDDMIASSSIGNFQSIGSSGHFQYDATSQSSGNGRSMFTKNQPTNFGGAETRPRNVALLMCIKY